MKAAKASIVAAVIAVIGVVACSAASQHPGADPDCVPEEGVICSPAPGGGSSGGDDAGSSACEVDGGSAACDQCLAGSCCSQITTCDGNTDCVNLVSCEDSCNDSASCFSGCQSQYPLGVDDLQAITTCEEARCTICAESGLGNPCSSGFGACVAGITCNGLWCSKPCAHSSDCTGLGNGGDNVLGFPNACVLTGSGDVCVPECGSNTDCVDFPGTYCEKTMNIEGASVFVCAPLPDASTD